jgi:Legionella pneumophila major outer membrane protein precursor
MIGKTRLLLALAAMGTLVAAPDAFSQKPETAPAPKTVQAVESDVLPGLPQPPDAPTSLFAPPTGPACTPVPIPGPCCELDPRLDPPQLPPPGWFTDLDLGIVDPHVKNKLLNTVTIVPGTADFVHVPSAQLDWTVAPRFELGYRLPSGFGEFVLGYRFLASDGTETVFGADGPQTLKSRLDINEWDLDYASREWSLWPHCDMKWRFGLRLDSVYFDSNSAEPFAAAAAGSGLFPGQTNVFGAATSNRFVGFGPHWGLELDQRFDEYGLALYAKADGWISLGRVRQSFTEDSTIVVAGVPLIGMTTTDTVQAVVSLLVEAGVRWQPPIWHYTYFYAGYTYEYFWNVGRNSDTFQPFPSRGELDDQGIVLRVELNF